MQSSSLKRVPGFDGLRAIAVGLVLFQHDFFAEVNPVWSPGPIGVRLFFVLSGFLITTILIHAWDRAQAEGCSRWHVWRTFMVRRTLRIFPLAYAAMGLAWLLGIPAMHAYGAWYWCYLGNVRTALAGEIGGDGLSHFWSLAVEEQFYLLWPLVILYVPRRAWKPLALGLLVAAAAARALHVAHGGLLAAYVLPWCRVDALAFGGWLALRNEVRLFDLTFLGIGLLGAALLADSQPLYFSLGDTGATLLSGVVVLGVARGAMQSLLSIRLLTALGGISYGVYIWGGMAPMLLMVMARSAGVPVIVDAWSTVLLTNVATLLLSWLSWHLLEEPMIQLKAYFV